MVDLKHSAAIVGIHEHVTRYAPDKSELQIQGESVIKALEDAGPWLLGEYSLADICIIPVMMRVEDIGLAYLWDDCPAVARWFEQFQERPALQNSFYHGSLLSEQYGDVGADTTRTSTA